MAPQVFPLSFCTKMQRLTLPECYVWKDEFGQARRHTPWETAAGCLREKCAAQQTNCPKS